MKSRLLFLTGFVLVAGGLLLSGCSGSTMSLRGGGSTFVGPMMEKWRSVYGKQKNIEIEYTLNGSGDGIRQMTSKFYHFGCTDSPMNDEQLAAAKKTAGDVVHLPLVMGGVVPIFNLHGVADIKFSGQVLADIYLGKITKWNDPALKALNPDVELPDLDLIVVRRSDPSGTTFIWTDYLSKVSSEWQEKVGPGAIEVKWPVGVGEKGSDGISGKVLQQPGSIGYVELNYAKNKKLSHGSVRNSAGKDIKADMDGITAAAEGIVASAPDDLCYTLTNMPGEKAYPICGTVWAVMYVQSPSRTSADTQALKDFFKWILHDGQKLAKENNYAPLPEGLVQKVEAKLETIK